MVGSLDHPPHRGAEHDRHGHHNRPVLDLGVLPVAPAGTAPTAVAQRAGAEEEEGNDRKAKEIEVHDVAIKRLGVGMQVVVMVVWWWF